MDFLYLLLAVYWLVTMVTFWVLFYRFIRLDDLRGRGAAEIIDPSDGVLMFFLEFVLLFFALAVANPIRFGHLVVKAVFWPVTAWFAVQGGRTSTSSPISDGALGRVTNAPRLSTTFFEDVLVREGYPATPHNVFALQERLGIMFTTKARQFMEGMGSAADWQQFLGRAAYPRSASDMPSWPQRVLDAVVEWDGDAALHLQDFPEKYVEMLLEGKGAGTGFFGGPPSEPLPTANAEWHMRGIGQPNAVPLPPPASPPVPEPRAASTGLTVARAVAARSQDGELTTSPLLRPSHCGPMTAPPPPRPAHVASAMPPQRIARPQTSAAFVARPAISPATSGSAPAEPLRSRGSLPLGPPPRGIEGGRHARPEPPSMHP